MSDGVTLEAQLQLRVKFWLKDEFTEGIVDYLDSCVVHLPLWLSLRIQISLVLDPKVHSCLGYSHGTSLVAVQEEAVVRFAKLLEARERILDLDNQSDIQ